MNFIAISGFIRVSVAFESIIGTPMECRSFQRHCFANNPVKHKEALANLPDVDDRELARCGLDVDMRRTRVV